MRAILSSCLALALCASPITVLGQTVHGHVLDSLDGRPTTGALVLLLDTYNAALVRASTDTAGFFRLQAPAAGTYRVRVQRLGYRAWVFPPFDVHDGDTLTATLVISWTRATPELEPIVVEAEASPTRTQLTEFWNRRARGAGDFVTRAEFERQGAPQTPTHVLRRMQGVRVQRNPQGGAGPTWIVTMNRSASRTMKGRGDGPIPCPPLFFIDRLYVGNANTTDIDQILPLLDVEAIEVYQTAASLPAELNRIGASCGVIAFWTR